MKQAERDTDEESRECGVQALWAQTLQLLLSLVVPSEFFLSPEAQVLFLVMLTWISFLPPATEKHLTNNYVSEIEKIVHKFRFLSFLLVD